MNEIEKAIFHLNVFKENTIGRNNHHYQTGMDTIGVYETAISALEAQQADLWIPITERLPKEDRCISTYTTLRHKESGHVFSAKLRWYFGKFEWFNGKSYQVNMKLLLGDQK